VNGAAAAATSHSELERAAVRIAPETLPARDERREELGQKRRFRSRPVYRSALTECQPHDAEHRAREQWFVLAIVVKLEGRRRGADAEKP
jgi:hypothetical protein